MSSKKKTSLILTLFILSTAGISTFFLLKSRSTSTIQPEPLIVHEYLLAGGPDISTDRLVFKFAEGEQEQILTQTAPYRDMQHQLLEYNNRALAPFGYRQEMLGDPPGQYFRIVHGDQITISHALFVLPVSVNASNTDFITEIEGFDGTYILTADRLEKRTWPPGREPYLYVGGQLLSVEVNNPNGQEEIIRVYLDDEMIYQSKMLAGRPTYGIFDGPWSYNGHWALILLDGKQDAQGTIEFMPRLIQDGKDINLQFGYEASFQFTVLDGRPFYFFQKAEQVGFSFDGQEFDQHYDEVPHYNCCSLALQNPQTSLNMIWFFARRGDNWYYVEAYIPASDTP